MGRNRTPTAILDAKGTFLVNPQRARSDEPATDRPLGSPPRYLTDAEKKVWKELADQCLPGVVFESDRTEFEMLVRLKAKMIDDFWSMKSADKALLVTLGSKFAMTPADRSKVTVDKPKESKLSKFLGSRHKTSSPDNTVQ